MANKNILVVGDVIVDEFQYGTALGISAETPTVVAKSTEYKREFGGAALICRHLASLGANVTLLTNGNFKTMEPVGLKNVDIFSSLYTWKISTKSRCFVDGYKMVQYDDLNEHGYDDEKEDKFCDDFNWIIKNKEIDWVVIADNNHGVITEKIAKHIIDSGIKVAVDAQFSQTKPNYDWYIDCDILFVNEKEYNFHSVNVPKNVIVKYGEGGVTALLEKNTYYQLGIKIDVLDTCGAGDALLAAFLATDLDCEDALRFSNEYAAYNCTLPGTQVPTLEQFRDFSKGLR